MTLAAAAEAGRLALVRRLLAKGADPNEESGHPLLAAVRGRHVSVVESLLEAGASPHLAGRHGATDPLFALCCMEAESGDDPAQQIAALLIDRGADIHTPRGGMTPAQAAIFNHATGPYRALREAGGDGVFQMEATFTGFRQRKFVFEFVHDHPSAIAFDLYHGKNHVQPKGSGVLLYADSITHPGASGRHPGEAVFFMAMLGAEQAVDGDVCLIHPHESLPPIPFVIDRIWIATDTPPYFPRAKARLDVDLMRAICQKNPASAAALAACLTP